MRDAEGRKKEARSNKQTRQSNTAHPRQSLFLEKMNITCELSTSRVRTFSVDQELREVEELWNELLHISGRL